MALTPRGVAIPTDWTDVGVRDGAIVPRSNNPPRECKGKDPNPFWWHDIETTKNMKAATKRHQAHQSLMDDGVTQDLGPIALVPDLEPNG